MLKLIVRFGTPGHLIGNVDGRLDYYDHLSYIISFSCGSEVIVGAFVGMCLAIASCGSTTSSCCMWKRFLELRYHLPFWLHTFVDQLRNQMPSTTCDCYISSIVSVFLSLAEHNFYHVIQDRAPTHHSFHHNAFSTKVAPMSVASTSNHLPTLRVRRQDGRQGY